MSVYRILSFEDNPHFYKTEEGLESYRFRTPCGPFGSSCETPKSPRKVLRRCLGTFSPSILAEHDFESCVYTNSNPKGLIRNSRSAPFLIEHSGNYITMSVYRILPQRQCVRMRTASKKVSGFILRVVIACGLVPS
jgi:hypothetical protein